MTVQSLPSKTKTGSDLTANTITGPNSSSTDTNDVEPSLVTDETSSEPASLTGSSMYLDPYGSARRKTVSSMRDELQNLKHDLDSLLSRDASLSDTELQDAHTRMMAKFCSLRYAARGCRRPADVPAQSRRRHDQ